jgi:primosomal protein N' (replication factor Y)
MHALVSGDRERFLEREKQGREEAGMPPYGRLAGIVISGTKESEVRALAQDLARRAPRGPGIDTFGPAPAPLSLLRGRFRWRLLVKAGRDVNIQAALRTWLAPVQLRGSLRLQIDVDPLSFL